MVVTDTRNHILAYLEQQGSASVKQLAGQLQMSSQALHRQLNKLVDSGKIKKLGKAPRVQYCLADDKTFQSPAGLSADQKSVIEQKFIQVTPEGKLLEGETAFIYWCQKFKLDASKTAREYVTAVNKYEAFRKDELIEGTEKLARTFKDIYVDRLFYIDFYAIERFGKTRLGTLLLLAKQSQSKRVSKQLTQEIKPCLEKLIRQFDLDGIAFVPPSVPRQIQIMKEIKGAYAGVGKLIDIQRLTGDIVVPQKSLGKLSDRIANVHNGFAIKGGQTVKHLLLVDDALGSGATLNEIAHVIKQKKLCTGKIIALTITGSPKGFEVIQEV